VDGVAGPPVPAPREPVDLPVAGGHLDRRGAVAGGEVISVSEAGHLADLADRRGRDDGADAEQPGQRGAGGPDGGGELLLGIAHLGIDAAQVRQELGGELTAVG